MTDLGLVRAHTKKISEGYSLGPCLRVYTRMRLTLMSFYCLVVAVSVITWERYITNDFSYRDTTTAIGLIVAYYVLSSFASMLSSTHLAKRDATRAQAIALSDSLARFVATLGVMFVAPTVVNLCLAYVIGGVVSLVVGILVSRSEIRVTVSSREPIRALRAEYISYAAPLAFSSAITTVFYYLDKVIIQLAMSPSDTARYFVSQQLLSAYMYLGAAVISLMFPFVSEACIRSGSKDTTLSFVTGSMRMLLLVTTPVTLVTAFLSGGILTVLVSPTFSGASHAFSLLALSSGLWILSMPFNSLMLGLGYTSQYARYSVIQVVLVIILDFLLIPSSIAGFDMANLGILGAALSVLVGQIVNMMFLVSFAVRRLKWHPPEATTSIVVSALAAAGLSLIVYWIAPMPPLLKLAVAILVNFTAFLSIVLSFGITSFEEVRRILSAVLLRARRRDVT